MRLSSLLLTTALLLGGGAATAHAQLPSTTENPWMKRTGLNIAHQGGEIEAPSDTMYAFRTALDKGVDVLEMDVHLSGDGQVVVLHDGTVDRTTNGTGSVEEMTVAEIQALDAAHWFVPGRGTTSAAQPEEYTLRGIATGERPAPEGYAAHDFVIPTLEEVLKAFPDTLLNIELKPTQRQTGQLELAVSNLLGRYERTDDVIVVSFIDSSIELFKALSPDVTTAPATGTVAAFYASAQGPLPGAPNPRHHALQVPTVFGGIPVTSADFIANAHANGLAVHVWTINDRATMEQLLDQGADGIMTDRPTLLEQILRERAKEARKGPKRTKAARRAAAKRRAARR